MHEHLATTHHSLRSSSEQAIAFSSWTNFYPQGVYTGWFTRYYRLVFTLHRYYRKQKSFIDRIEFSRKDTFRCCQFSLQMDGLEYAWRSVFLNGIVYFLSNQLTHLDILYKKKKKSINLLSTVIKIKMITLYTSSFTRARN